MIWNLALLLTFASFPKTLSLQCCDSTRYPRDLKLVKGDNKDDFKVATYCYDYMRMTQPPLSKDRGHGAGKQCDYCIIEAFFKQDEAYYLQSCGSFETADFEFQMATLEPSDIDNPNEKDVVDGVKEKHFLDMYIRFGDDLSDETKYNNKTTIRACSIHKNRKGYWLERKGIDAGVEETGIKTDTREKLDDFESVACACFDNNCNAFENVIPTKADLKLEETEKIWDYDSKDI